MKKKVLLMGASGSGKTSMRSVIFSNNPASLTSRLGATIDVEQNHVRFLGDLVLNLWDCGGQDSFMDSYLTVQRSTIFQHVGVMIYVFDIESRELEKDLTYYRECLESLKRFSPDAAIFLLVHKMDLIAKGQSPLTLLEKKRKELQEHSGTATFTMFGTSIYDESLYKAWSRIVHTLIPNADLLSKHLSIFADACKATEVIMFERTTFLVIATSMRSSNPNTNGLPSSKLDLSVNTFTDDGDIHNMNTTRYEQTSELIKAFKQACARMREEFHSLEMELPEFTAVLDGLTKNTYIMVVTHDPTIETAAIKMNIELARSKFEELQADNMT